MGTHTSTEKSPKPWSAQKVFAPDSSSTPVKKPPSALVTSCQSDKCQKVPSSANWKRNLVIEVRSLKLPVVTAPLSPATQTPAKPESSETAGQRFEVSPKIQSSIPTEEETTNISVNHLPSDETPLQVKRSVLSPPDEPVESEVPESSTTKKKNKKQNNNNIIICLFNNFVRKIIITS